MPSLFYLIWLSAHVTHVQTKISLYYLLPILPSKEIQTLIQRQL